MKKYNYYTPTELAERMLQLLPHDAVITSIADICCGTWNLLKAAHIFYPSASIIGVDIDAVAKEKCIEGATFYSADGREFANEAEQEGIKFDLLLSNPPFGLLSPEEKKYVGNENVFICSRRYEAEMFYANSKLVKDNGYLLSILPITYVWGTQYQKHRIWIAKHFRVLGVVTLCPTTFGNKMIHTAALLLQKTDIPQNCATSFLSAYPNGNTWSLCVDFELFYERIVSGNWNLAYQECYSNLKIYRGSISSHFFSESGIPVLHCSNLVKNGIWKPSVRYCKGIQLPNEKCAESGDIIINRIGKCAGTWTIYTGPKCLITDCLIVVKQPNQSVLEKIVHLSENGILQVPRLGVSTPYITARDVVCTLGQGKE